jgi:hypothetical protein
MRVVKVMIKRLSRCFRAQVPESIESRGPVQIELDSRRSRRLGAKTVGRAAQVAMAECCNIDSVRELRRCQLSIADRQLRAKVS